MPCYRKGGCGPYEMFSCSECPASKKEYLENSKRRTNPNRDLKIRAIASAEDRLRKAKFNLEYSNGNNDTIERKKRAVEVAEFTLKAVKSYEP